ncbi:MAG: hypothetical protein ABI339_01180 [Solirubrobacteraceae bacterium]
MLLLPAKLEAFELEGHARALLDIPRVIALEPARVRTPRFMRDAASARQAKRIRFPGLLSVVVLYHPAQYPLARALCAGYEEAELWYVAPDRASLGAAGGSNTAELLTFDSLARERATGLLAATDGANVEDDDLRVRLHELDVINARAFIPGGRSRGG